MEDEGPFFSDPEGRTVGDMTPDEIRAELAHQQGLGDVERAAYLAGMPAEELAEYMSDVEREADGG